MNNKFIVDKSNRTTYSRYMKLFVDTLILGIAASLVLSAIDLIVGMVK